MVQTMQRNRVGFLRTYLKIVQCSKTFSFFGLLYADLISHERVW